MRPKKFDTHKTLEHWPAIAQKAAFVGERHSVFLGDARRVLADLPAESVNTCLTSPPYWDVRDYGVEGQIGLESDIESYIQSLAAVFAEVHRVLRADGTVWLNLGDKYLNGVSGKLDLGWQRNKQLALVPFRVAIALQEQGWWVRNTMVWQKPNAMPVSAQDRLSNCWEPIFLLTKNERYFFNLDPNRVPHLTDDQVERQRAERGLAQGKAKGKSELRQWLNSPRHRATIDGVKEVGRRPNAPDPVELADYLKNAAAAKGLSLKQIAGALQQPFERVRHYFRTDRIGSRLPPENTWEQLQDLLDLDGTYDEAMTIEYGDNVFRNHPNGRNPGDVQSFAVASVAGQHFATMPYKLARWTLASTLPTDGVCLDPFMGQGTTGRAALELGGRFVGIDIHREYIEEFVRDYAHSDQLQAAE